MLNIFRKATKISSLSVMVAVALFSCSKSPLKDPAADDLSDLSIDPNQPAIPADASSDLSGNLAQGRQTDATSAEQSNKVIEDVPPTPRIEDLERDRTSVDNTTVEPEPPLNRPPADSGKDVSRFGSGPQVRYIKAAELNVRERPDRYSKIVGVLKGGDKVRVLVKGGWAKLDEGRWIRSRWLVKGKPSGTVYQDRNGEESHPLKQNKDKKRKPKTTRKNRI